MTEIHNEQERRENMEEILSVLKSGNAKQTGVLSQSEFPDEEIVSLLLEQKAKEDEPTEFFGEPTSTSFTEEFFNNNIIHI